MRQKGSSKKQSSASAFSEKNALSAGPASATQSPGLSDGTKQSFEKLGMPISEQHPAKAK